VALEHNTVAVIDLSMPARSRFGLSYNGEVYNAPELRAELEAAGRKFSRPLRH
jgi:asparagine synthase (glutamine-hydrolysing)